MTNYLPHKRVREVRTPAQLRIAWRHGSSSRPTPQLYFWLHSTTWQGRHRQTYWWV